jgi:pimeloyl-ACP methyl ester carboxylesterase
MMRKISYLFFIALMLLCFTGFGDEGSLAQQDYDLSFPGIQLRENAYSTIHCRVYVNENCPDSGASIFAIHGLGHTAATWEKLAEAIFAKKLIGEPVSSLIAVDLPGRGGSSVPDSILLGDLLLEDYVNVVSNTLDKLVDAKLKPTTIIAHSMGTMVAQQLQQTLINQGTTLKKRFKIKSVILLAPTLPAGMSYAIIDSGGASEFFKPPFLTYAEDKGTYLYFPEYVWPMVFFSNRLGQVALGTPPVEDMAAKKYSSPESFLYALQIAGALPPSYSRPIIDTGIFNFNKGTELKVVGFENDRLLLPEEGQTLYTHLTDDKAVPFSEFILINGDDTVHDYYISEPAKLVDKIFRIND